MFWLYFGTWINSTDLFSCSGVFFRGVECRNLQFFHILFPKVGCCLNPWTSGNDQREMTLISPNLTWTPKKPATKVLPVPAGTLLRPPKPNQGPVAQRTKRTIGSMKTDWWRPRVCNGQSLGIGSAVAMGLISTIFPLITFQQHALICFGPK